MVPAVILAGGKARRMGGGDKGLLPLGDETILAHVVARLSPQAEPVALNANGDPARFDALGLPVLRDPVPDHPGPLAGVLAGLLWARAAGADHVITVAADTPFFPRDLVDVMARTDAPIVLAETPDGRHPTFGLWSTHLVAPLTEALAQGTRRVVAFTDAHGAASAAFTDQPFNPFFNVNTPDDLSMAEDILKAHAP
ncbi:MAG: molybdenum cofactor guanylyltransferase MobA [Pseudomonadota bacterium]